MELQSPAIGTLTLNDAFNFVKQFTQTLLTLRVTIEKKSAASQWNRVDQVRVDRDEEWMKKNEKITSQFDRVDAECRECSNMKIQNAISILSNTINNNSIQKLKKTHNTFHVAGFFESKHLTQCTEVETPKSYWTQFTIFINKVYYKALNFYIDTNHEF